MQVELKELRLHLVNGKMGLRMGNYLFSDVW